MSLKSQFVYYFQVVEAEQLGGRIREAISTCQRFEFESDARHRYVIKQDVTTVTTPTECQRNLENPVTRHLRDSVRREEE